MKIYAFLRGYGESPGYPISMCRITSKTSWRVVCDEYSYCNVLGVLYSRWNFIALQKSTHYSQKQPATLRTHVDVRPALSRNAHSYRILPTGPLVAIFQHSLPFLQSESFQTHVATIHRRAIGPLALHNGTSAYTSLTHHSPSPTIDCLHRPPYKLTCFSHNFRYELSLPTTAAKYTRSHPTDLQTRLDFSRIPNTIVACVLLLRA
jgi:hypothetical protein